jgi:hypothetical protein
VLYAILGIPLLFRTIVDMGKSRQTIDPFEPAIVIECWIPKIIKLPWFLLNLISRRVFRCCTRQTRDEIRSLDAEDLRGEYENYALKI